MEYITIQIQKTDHLRKTPVSQDDMKELLGMLGFSETANLICHHRSLAERRYCSLGRRTRQGCGLAITGRGGPHPCPVCFFCHHTLQSKSCFSHRSTRPTFFDFIATGTGDAVVDAVPGSGKTTTCVEASKRLKTRRALFCAFNKHIADELNTRLDGMRAQTIHSVGLSSLRPLGRPEVDAKKYSKLVREYLIDSGITEQETLTTASSRIRDLLRLAQLTLADAEEESALRDIADRFDLDRADWAFTWKAIAPILNRGMELAPEVIDYNDMVWLPHVLSLAPRKVDWVFVDEAQDLNRAQLELVMKARANGGRMLFVGDKRQAIYGFTGADTQSIPNIIDRTQATVLPLSICLPLPDFGNRAGQ